MNRRFLALLGLLLSFVLFFTACTEPAVSGSAAEAASAFTIAELHQETEEETALPSETPSPEPEIQIEQSSSETAELESTIPPENTSSNSATPNTEQVNSVPSSADAQTISENIENIEEKNTLSCTFSINCTNAIKNEALTEEKATLLPADGIILASQEVSFAEGDTVFDILLQLTKKNKIHMEFSTSPLYETRYIEGIQNLYEFDCGELSGWMYKVNGVFPKYGCSQYVLEHGDVVEWVYTCDLGRDVGSTFGSGGQQGEVTP